MGGHRDRRRSEPVLVALIGENRLFLDALAERLNDFAEVAVVACLAPSTVSEMSGSVDVAIVDINGHEDRIASLLRQARSVQATWLLALLDDIEPGRVTRALRHGAAAFASKSTPARALAETIGQVARGQLTVPVSLLSQIAAEAADQERSQRELQARFQSLSAREREVLARLLAGENAAQIAAGLFVSNNTVRTHTRHIFDKLGVRSQVEAITLSLKTGFARRDNGVDG